MRKIIGAVLVGIPFIALAIVGYLSIGFLPMLSVFAATAAVVAMISFGFHLLLDPNEGQP